MRKILTAFTLMLIMLFVLTANVHAYTYSVKLSPAKTNLKSGETVTVDIMMNTISLEENEAGIIGIEADLEYDTTVFSKASISGEGQWSEGENITKIKGVLLGNEIKETGKIATITLTVAENAKLGNTAVTLKNVQASNGTSGIVTASNASVNFLVVEVVDDGNTDNGNDPGTGNENNNQGNNDNTGNENSNQGNNENTGNENNNQGNNENTGNENSNQGNNDNTGSENNNQGNNNNTGNENNSNTGNNTDNSNKNNTINTNNSVANNTTKDNTIANKVLSAAGLEKLSVIIVAVLIIVVSISYMSYKKYKNM